MESKKVLLLIDSLGVGGAERQLTELAIGLKEKGCDVNFVVFPVSTANHFESILRDVSINLEYDHQGKNKFRRIFEIARICRSRKIDTVIAYKGGVCMAASLSSFMHRSKIIVSERSTTQRLSLIERLKFFCYRFADCIVTNSFSQQAFIQKQYPNLLKKTEVITNMVDCDRFHPADNKRKREIPIILTTARITPAKNILNYIEALGILKHEGVKFKAVWYGDVLYDQVYYKAVKEKSNECDVEDCFEIRPPVLNVEEIYRQVDIYCLPSIYEGFPNVICEAMASGLPIACSNICDNPYIVEDGINGVLFNPTDSQNIADQLREIINEYNNGTTNYLSDNREKIVKLCEKDKFLTNYLNIL